MVDESTIESTNCILTKGSQLIDAACALTNVVL